MLNSWSLGRFETESYKVDFMSIGLTAQPVVKTAISCSSLCGEASLTEMEIKGVREVN